MFDEKTEALCKELDIDVWFPPAALRNRCDNKMETVRIGNKAGVPSVPNALSKVEQLRAPPGICIDAGIGHDIVIQTAFGDSGHTTFFISNEEEWRKHADEITAEHEVKIMKRISCRGSTLEACVTRCGTIVGAAVDGDRWAEGPDAIQGWMVRERGLSRRILGRRAREGRASMAFKFGNQLWQEGYRGYFDLDFLIDRDGGDVYLGELNPRVCGASPMTNHAAFAYADVPLFLFHLLEFSGQEFDLDVEALNARWADPEFIDSWSQIVIKHTEDNVDVVTQAPPTGIWKQASDGSVVLSPVRLSPRRRRKRARGVLPAHHRKRRLSLRGRGSRHTDHARALDDRGFRRSTGRADNWIKGLEVLLLRQTARGRAAARRRRRPERSRFSDMRSSLPGDARQAVMWCRR